MRYENHEAAIADLTEGFRAWKLGRKVVAHDGGGVMLLLRGRPGEHYWSTMTELDSGDRIGALVVWDGISPPPQPSPEPENDPEYEAYANSCECPLCGDTTVTKFHDGPPSMLGAGRSDPDTLDLACGHSITWDPCDGRDLVYDADRKLVHQGSPRGDFT